MINLHLARDLDDMDIVWIEYIPRKPNQPSKHDFPQKTIWKKRGIIFQNMTLDKNNCHDF